MGDVPTWVAAIFAGGAAVFAGVTMVIMRRQIGMQRDQLDEQREFIAEQSQNLQLERAELRAQAEDRRVAQARQVIMSVTALTSAEPQSDGGGPDTWQVRVRNPSDAPIRDVVMSFGGTLGVRAIRAPGFSTTEDVPLPVLGGDRMAEFLSTHVTAGVLDDSPPVVNFTDDAGVRWRLDSLGRLREEQP
ncbi:hypothetical protein [Streptomyces sp. NPDC096153]|uniref:hypothetical protein n=1 Tax=Streptomyces sp. NPDC096153 TaxID=3155548 RepID=UPI003327519B